jgi:hypothetical protein
MTKIRNVGAIRKQGPYHYEYIAEVDSDCLDHDKLWVIPYNKDYYYISDIEIHAASFYDYFREPASDNVEEQALDILKKDILKFFNQRISIDEYEKQKISIREKTSSIHFYYFDDIPASNLKLID